MPLDRQALEGFDEEKAHQEAAKHVDRQGRVRKVAPVDGLNQISHRIPSPTAKSAPYCNCKVRLHSPEFLRRRILFRGEILFRGDEWGGRPARGRPTFVRSRPTAQRRDKTTRWAKAAHRKSLAWVTAARAAGVSASAFSITKSWMGPV